MKTKGNTFGNYKFESWVPVKVAQQIMEFWGCFDRNYKEWLENPKIYIDEMRLPRNGQKVVFYVKTYLKEDSYFKYEGRYIHAWNNMGRIVFEDMTYKCVSSCDDWYPVQPPPTPEGD